MQRDSRLNCEWLLSPFSEGDFLSSYWGRKPLFVRRKEEGYYEGILSLCDVDDLLSSGSVHPTNIRLVQGQSHVPSDEYVSNDGLVDPIEVVKRFDQGHTIVLEQTQRYRTGLRRLCDELTDDLGFAFQTNLYLTPPLSQGFDLHYDTHDVFVLQIHGNKRWTIHGSPIPLPLPGQTYERCELSSGGETLGGVLVPGDLLYIPRGYFHSATSLDYPSLHITLGALTKTWTDILLEVVAVACAKDPVFRESLPVRLFSPNRDLSSETATSHFAELWQKISNSIDFVGVIRQFSADVTRQRRPTNTGHVQRITELRNLSRDSFVKARSVPISWRVDEGTVTVIAFEKEISFPSFAINDLQDLLSGEEIQVQRVRGAVGMEGKLALARRLVLEGLLDIVRV